MPVGEVEGSTLGLLLGLFDGCMLVGEFEGCLLGLLLGLLVGSSESVGFAEGCLLGLLLGEADLGAEGGT